jgi:hypothetical protein
MTQVGARPVLWVRSLASRLFEFHLVVLGYLFFVACNVKSSVSWFLIGTDIYERLLRSCRLVDEAACVRGDATDQRRMGQYADGGTARRSVRGGDGSLGIRPAPARGQCRCRRRVSSVPQQPAAC